MESFILRRPWQESFSARIMSALLANRPQRRSGFALVVALALMAFVLTLILSMSLLVTVETQAASTSLDALRAKESAKLALYIAVGELQKNAGPDQRVTARAEILGGSIPVENIHWTGVWDTTNPSQSPTWLVSGIEPTPEALGADLSTLYRPPSETSVTEDVVLVPVQNIPSENARETNYAWWISDEGSKVHVALPERLEPLDDGFFTEFSATGLSTEEQNQILNQSTARRFKSELFFGNDTSFVPSEAEDIKSSAVYNKIQSANNSLRKLQGAIDAGVLDGIDSTESVDAFHHATTFSMAVIANTANGGLKIDLSDRTYSDANGAFKVNDATKDFLWASSPDLNAQIGFKGMDASDISSLNANDPVCTTPVLVTEGALYFVISGQTKSSTTARAFLRFEGEMWSPYGFRHLFTGSSSSNTPELIIEFEDLPDISLQFYDKDSDEYTSSTALSFDEISPIFEIDFTDTHKAGEIRKIAGDWPINASSDKSNFYYTTAWDWTVVDPAYNREHRSISYPDGDSINYQAAESKITMLIKNSDGKILQRIENIPVGAINTDFAFYESSPSSLSQTSAPIAFQFRMRDDLPDLEDWFSLKDPRGITLDFSDAKLMELYDINDIDGDKLMNADFPKFNAFANLDFFHGQQNNNFFRLFDMPAAPPISVGAFQHLQFKDSPPFAVGNPWGEDLNEVFDRFYISSIPRDLSQSFWSPEDANHPGSLPNPFLIIRNQDSLSADDLIGNDSAKHLYSEGAFNFNSTSIEAWQAVLQGNTIYDWAWYKNRGTSTEEEADRLNLESTFFRLPNSGHLRSESFTKWEFPFESYEDELSTTDDYPYLDEPERELTFRNHDSSNPIKDWRPAASLGHRELDTGSVKELATKIVEKLQVRGRPFGSFKELLNSGLVQEAINETPINSIEPSTRYVDASPQKRLPKNSTAYLSQADIFSALSPAMCARSDTFRIRAYASIDSTINQSTVARAYCEAIVQRTPERIDGDESRIMENAEGFGRRFKIIDIRWIDVSQL